MATRVGQHHIEEHGHGHFTEHSHDLAPRDVLEAVDIVDPVTLMAQGHSCDEIIADIQERTIVTFDGIKAGFRG